MQTSGTSTALRLSETSRTAMKVLVIDDSEIDRQRLIRLCRSAGLNFEATEVATLAEMRDALNDGQFDLLFIDYLLAGEDGLQAIELLKSFPGQSAASIMIAGEGRLDIAVEAMRRGCSDYVTKNTLSVDALQKSIATAMERRLFSAAVSEERSRRLELERTVRTYANACSAEMRSLLAATLRRVRKLREHGTGEAFVTDLADVETHIDRLWTSMPAFAEGCERALGEIPRPAVPRLS